MITREYTGNYRTDNDEENDDNNGDSGDGKVVDGHAGDGRGLGWRRGSGRSGGRSAAIGIINDRNRTKMRTGRVRRRR